MSAYRCVFGQHDLLHIGHNVNLELTLPFLLGPVPWSLSIPGRTSTQTDESKHLNVLQSHIEPTLDWPCSAAHNFDGNAILQSLIAFPVTFKDLMEPVFNQALKAGHVGFVTDTHIQCISSSLYSLTFSQRITWVFCSTLVYATKGGPSETSLTLARIWGKRSTVIHCLTDCDTTNVPIC